MRAQGLLLFLLSILTTAAFGAPATAFRVTLPPTVIYAESFNFTVEAIDGTGTVDPTYAGTVTFTAPGDFMATLPSNYTFTAGDAGVHVFSAMLTVYGDRTITVTDAGNATITGSDTTSLRYGPGATQRFLITAPDTGNLGEPFNFTVTAADIDGNPTGSDYTGTIKFDSSRFSGPADYTFTPADNGSKTFSATPTRGGVALFSVRDTAYPAVFANHTMEVACPTFTVTASNNGPVCPNVGPTLTATTSETGVTFEWRTTPTGFYEAHGQVVTGLENYDGAYIVTMRHPTNGCVATATTDVDLNSTTPDVDAVGPDFVCDTFETSFTIADEAENGPYTNIVWTLDMSSSGTIVAGQGTPTVTVRGNYRPGDLPFQGIRVYLSATNGAGCVFSNGATANVDVLQRPIGTIQTVANACPGTTYSATPHVDPIAGNPPVTHQWSIENGTITEFNQTTGAILYTVSGEGDAVLTLVNSTPHCSYTTTKTVTAGPSASIASASHTICAGEEVQIPVTLSGQPPFTIGWSDGALQTVNASFTRTVAPTQTTHYSIVSVSDANCNNVSATGSVDVTTSTSAVITQQPRDTTVARGQRATLTVDVEPDATAIQWYRGLPGDTSDPIDGANSLELITPPITQTTTFWVEIETSCGTQMSDAATVKVSSRRRAVRHP